MAVDVLADVLIVGAGVSGLMAARTLESRGYSVRLMDKRRRVGGRLATDRIGGGLADYGAQFFTARAAVLQNEVGQWLKQDLVYVWGTGWSDGSLKPVAADGHPRYAARGGMNQLAAHLAQGLDIALGRAVISIQMTAGGWRLIDEDDAVHEASALVMTPPVPQTLELLDASAVQLHPQDLNELRRIRFGPCLCGLHEIEGEIDLPPPGALQNFQSDVYWIADNRAKGISAAKIVTSHASPKYSRQHWDDPPADIIAKLEAALRPHLQSGRIVHSQLKKWRYSIPLTTHPQECLLAKDLPNLVFAGDAFGGRGRVEGAFMSGIAAGHALAAALA